MALDPDLLDTEVVVAGDKLNVDLKIPEEGITDIMLHVALEVFGAITSTSFRASL